MSEHCVKPFNGCVRKALERYFSDLDGHPPGELYQLMLAEMERPLLEEVMQRSGGNQTQASQLLGINRSTLRKKLQHYGLDG